MKYFFPILFLLTLNVSAQDLMLTKEDISTAVDSLSSNLNRIYVFPDKAKEMSTLIQKNLKDGKYDLLTNPMDFSEKITADLVSVSKDLHIRFMYSPERVKMMKERNKEAEPNIEEMKKDGGKNNFGFKEVKILDGNIGYIKFNGFDDASIGGEAATAAMNFVAYTDAIIFDLRENGGGSPSMIQFITSYLYGEGEKIHLNNFYFRPNEVTEQTWTLPFVPGKRNPDAQVYVLTSNYTFSAAEEFTYNLKNLKRGTIVGEITGGGAHPGGMQIIAESFVCFIPNGRAINPITNTNWEGVGVIPDVKVSKEDALNSAHKLALDSLMKSSTNEEEIISYKWNIDILNAKMNPYQADTKKFKNYVGKFGPRSILFENNALYYQREGRPKFALAALAENLFYIEEQGIKVQMEMKDNKITAITIITEDGRTERNEKN
jgi:hypothetical protein